MRRLLLILIIVLFGRGFSCRAQVLENDLFCFENPDSLFTAVSGVLSSSQAKYSMVVGKKNNAFPMLKYIKQYTSFGCDKARVEAGAGPVVDYYFGNRSKVYIMAWRGKDKRLNQVNELYMNHRTALLSKADLEINDRVAVAARINMERGETVAFMGDTGALHRIIELKISQTPAVLFFPPVDFYYDLYQYYDKIADATVVALFYRVEINPKMRQNFPGEKSDSMLPDFEKYFKLKPSAPVFKENIEIYCPPLFEIQSEDTPTAPKGSGTPPKTPVTSEEPPLPPEVAVLKQSSEKVACFPVKGDAVQFAEDAGAVYILYKQGSLLRVDKQTGAYRMVLDDMSVTGLATDGKGQLLLYVTHRGVVRWNGKSIDTSPSIFKYNGGTGVGYKSRMSLTPDGNLLVYGGNSVPTAHLSSNGKLLHSSEVVKGDQMLMAQDGTIWTMSRSGIASGRLFASQTKHAYGDKWNDELSGLGSICLRDNDLLACGKKLLLFRAGKWDMLYAPKAEYLQYVAVDKQGMIWLASAEGLTYMGKDGKVPLKVLTSLNTPDGKKELSFIKGLYADTNGNIWIVTGRETLVYNPDGLMGIFPSIGFP